MPARKQTVLFVAAVSFVMAILRTFIVSVNLEKNSDSADIYYLPDNFVVLFFSIASVVLVLAFFVSAFKNRNHPIKFDDMQTASSIGSLLAAFLTFGTVIAYFFTYSDEKSAPIFTANGAPNRNVTNIQDNTIIETLVVAFAVACALKFLISGLKNHKDNKLGDKAVAVLTLFPIFFSALRLLDDFIQTSAIPFASSNGYHMVSLVAVLLFFLVEGKSYVFDSKSLLPEFFGYTAIFTLLVFAIPDVVLHSFGTFAFDSNTAFALTDIGFAIYITLRLHSAKAVTE